jgi:hypothetical protein
VAANGNNRRTIFTADLIRESLSQRGFANSGLTGNQLKLRITSHGPGERRIQPAKVRRPTDEWAGGVL